MTSKLVKCNNCNIVISEILSFIQNKVDVMDEESLVRICVSSFPVEDIEHAKNLLFDSITTTKRKITRKGDKKSQRELNDVISIFKETDPEEMPIFVAKDLQKLPPVTFDHVDVTRLLKDIVLIQKDLQIIKDTYISADKLQDIKTDLMHNCNYFKNKQQCIETLDISQKSNKCTNLPHNRENNKIIPTKYCGPGISSTSQTLTPSLSCESLIDKSVSLAKFQNCNDQHVEGLTAVSNTEIPLAADVQEEGLTDDNDLCETLHTQNKISGHIFKNSFACVVSSDKEWKENNPNDEWILAQKKRLKNRFSTLRGIAKIEHKDKFKAADIKVPLFVNNVDKNTSESDIISYFLNRTQVNVTLHKINSKVQREYNSYKMYVPREKLSVFLNDSVWPEGVMYRKFIEFKNRN